MHKNYFVQLGRALQLTQNVPSKPGEVCSVSSNIPYQSTLPMPEAFIVMLIEPGTKALDGNINKWKYHVLLY